MSLKIYVASAFGNKEAVREAHELLRWAGYEITHDWTQEDASHLEKGSDDYFAFLERCGHADLVGVRDADVVVVLAHPEMRDTRAEMGLALGMQKPVIVVEPHKAHSVFYGSCLRAPTMAHAMVLLTQQQRRVLRGY